VRRDTRNSQGKTECRGQDYKKLTLALRRRAAVAGVHVAADGGLGNDGRRGGGGRRREGAAAPAAAEDEEEEGQREEEADEHHLRADAAGAAPAAGTLPVVLGRSPRAPRPLHVHLLSPNSVACSDCCLVVFIRSSRFVLIRVSTACLFRLLSSSSLELEAWSWSTSWWNGSYGGPGLEMEEEGRE